MIHTTVKRSRAIKQNSLPQADAQIVFSCVGRLETCLPGCPTNRKVWPAPGKANGCFLKWGKIGSVENGKPAFNGTTFTWVELKEK